MSLRLSTTAVILTMVGAMCIPVGKSVALMQELEPPGMERPNVEHPNLEQMRGLKRFNRATELGDYSVLELKGVRVGDNVLAKAILLQEEGGNIRYISGGSRSRRVQFDFFQPYQDSELVQTVTLNFDKDNGFITDVQVNYKISSAYLSVKPVLDLVFANAVEKYGPPMQLSDIAAIANETRKSARAPVRLKGFIRGLRDSIKDDALRERVTAYFESRLVTEKTEFEATEQGTAKLLSGFNQCFYWMREAYSEWLSLCSFNPDSGNMRGQGIDVRLTNFAVHTSIEAFRSTSEDHPIIKL